jgi:ABC-type dipeptide/oligopeptide/nickel transport system ATPase component
MRTSKARPLADFLHLFGIRVIGFVGKSGTGKSYKCSQLARRVKADLIIDDGLLIKDSKIIAGKSAKQAPDYRSAVKTACFMDPDHRNSVIEALGGQKYKRIMILGTSEKMIEKIAASLSLPPVCKYIYIEQVATREEIETALRTRFSEGKHVVPVEAVDAVRSFSDIVQANQGTDKTMVRPRFTPSVSSVMGPKVFAQMLKECLSGFPEELKVESVNSQKKEGYELELKLSYFRAQGEPDEQEVKSYIIDFLERWGGVQVQSLTLELVPQD